MREAIISLLQKVKDNFSIKPGSPIYSYLIDPVVALYGYLLEQIEDKLTFSTSDLADLFLVQKNEGSNASVTLRLYFTEPISLDFGIEGMRFESNGVTYSNPDPIHITAEFMSLFVENGFYYYDVKIEGEQPVNSETVFSWINAPAEFSFLTIQSIDSPGQLPETEESLRSRIIDSLYQRTLTSEKSIIAWFKEKYGDFITDIQVIGFKDPEMTRNELEINGQTYKISGYIDTYIKGSYPSPYQKELNFYKIEDWELENQAGVIFYRENIPFTEVDHKYQYLWRIYVNKITLSRSLIRANDGTQLTDTDDPLTFVENVHFELYSSDEGIVRRIDPGATDVQYIIADYDDIGFRAFVDQNDRSVLWVLRDNGSGTYEAFTGNVTSLDHSFYNGLWLVSVHPVDGSQISAVVSEVSIDTIPAGLYQGGNQTYKLKLSKELPDSFWSYDGTISGLWFEIRRFEPVMFEYKYTPFGFKFTDLMTPLLWIDEIVSLNGLGTIEREQGYSSLGYSTAGYSGYNKVYWKAHVKDPDYRYSVLEDGIIEIVGPADYTVDITIYDYVTQPEVAITYRYAEKFYDIQQEVDLEHDKGTSHLVKHFITAATTFDELDLKYDGELDYSAIANFFWNSSNNIELSDFIDFLYDQGVTYVDLDDMINHMKVEIWNNDGTFTVVYPDIHGKIDIPRMARFLLVEAVIRND